MTKRATARSSQRRKGQELYAARLRAVQPLVSFTLRKRARTGYDKRKLKKYYEYLFGNDEGQGVAQGLRVKVTRKDPDKLRKIQRDLGQGELSGIKYAFVPTILDPRTGQVVKPKVTYREEQSTIVTVGSVGFIFEPFKQKGLIADVRRECNRVMDILESQIPERSEVRYKVMCADKTTFQNYRRQDVVAAVEFMMVEYGKTWTRWLAGLVCEFSSNTTHIRKYEDAKELQADTRKKIFKIRLDWMLALEALESQRGSAVVEVIARLSTGDRNDARTRVTMQELKRAGHVTGDDNRWTLLASGREYLKHGRNILPLYRRDQ